VIMCLSHLQTTPAPQLRPARAGLRSGTGEFRSLSFFSYKKRTKKGPRTKRSGVEGH